MPPKFKFFFSICRPDGLGTQQTAEWFLSISRLAGLGTQQTAEYLLSWYLFDGTASQIWHKWPGHLCYSGTGYNKAILKVQGSQQKGTGFSDMDAGM